MIPALLCVPPRFLAAGCSSSAPRLWAPGPLAKETHVANPFLVLGGIAVGLVVATFGVLQVPGWVASAQDAAAINDLSNLNQAQAIHMNTSGMFSADVTTLSGGAEAAGFGLEAPVATLAMSDMALASTDAYGIAFKLSDGVALKHLGTTDTGDAYCAVVQSASGRYFASTSTKTISDASETGLAAMNDAECVTEARDDYTGLEPGTDPQPEVPETPKFPEDQAIFKINTTLAGCTFPSLSIPLGTTPNATIDWGDGLWSKAYAGANQHRYAVPGEYTVTVEGTVAGFGSMSTTTADCITEVAHFGEDMGMTTLASMFAGMANVQSVSSPPASVTDLSRMFYNNKTFNDDLKWDVTHVKTMKEMFRQTDAFNGDISTWRPRNVTDMSSMFLLAKAFNGDLRGWETQSVENFTGMFQSAALFTSDLSGWNTGAATSMMNMFSGATAFNSDLRWDVRNVTTMQGMFQGASKFNGNVSTWKTDSLTNIRQMFMSAPVFNQDVSGWTTEKVTNMGQAFRGAIAFNRDITKWKTSMVTDMNNMFNGAKAFTCDISAWKVDLVSSSSQFSSGSGLTLAMIPAKFR